MSDNKSVQLNLMEIAMVQYIKDLKSKTVQELEWEIEKKKNDIEIIQTVIDSKK